MRANKVIPFYEMLKSAIANALVYSVFCNGMKKSATDILEYLRTSDNKQLRTMAKRIGHFMAAPDQMKQHNVPKPTQWECEKDFASVLAIVQFMEEIHL
jgi:hypothetical protein